MEDAEKISTPYSMNMNENIQVAFLNRLKKNGTVFHLTQLVSPTITPRHLRANQMGFIFTLSFLLKDTFYQKTHYRLSPPSISILAQPTSEIVRQNIHCYF
jgi:hypothetical protein